MSNEIYKPPKSDVETQKQPSGSVLKGSLIGVVVDILGTTVVGFLIGVAYTIFSLSMGINDQQQVLSELQSLYSPVGISAVIIGLFISFGAGYLSAKHSGNNARMTACIVSVISCAFGFLVGGGHYTTIEMIVLSVLTVSAIFAGSQIWQSKNRG